MSGVLVDIDCSFPRGVSSRAGRQLDTVSARRDLEIFQLVLVCLSGLSYSVALLLYYSILYTLYTCHSVYEHYVYTLYCQPQWHREKISPAQTHKIPNVSVNDSNNSNERFHRVDILNTVLDWFLDGFPGQLGFSQESSTRGGIQ